VLTPLYLYVLNPFSFSYINRKKVAKEALQRIFFIYPPPNIVSFLFLQKLLFFIQFPVPTAYAAPCFYFDIGKEGPVLSIHSMRE